MIYCKQLCWAYASRLIARQKSTILGLARVHQLFKATGLTCYMCHLVFLQFLLTCFVIANRSSVWLTTDFKTAVNKMQIPRAAAYNGFVHLNNKPLHQYKRNYPEKNVDVTDNRVRFLRGIWLKRILIKSSTCHIYDYHTGRRFRLPTSQLSKPNKCQTNK